jgi:hypothetical protein
MKKKDMSMEHFTIVRQFKRSRLEQEYLSSAYEIILPSQSMLLPCSRKINKIKAINFPKIRRLL